VRKEQENFGNTKFGRINRIIGRIFQKFGHRIPADLAENSAKFYQKPTIEAKKSQKILA
jgi:hypothetical protein